MLKITVEGRDHHDKNIPDVPAEEANAYQLKKGNDEETGSRWYIGDEVFDGDIVRISDTHYHVIWKDRSFTVEVTETDFKEKTFRLLINGESYSSSVKDQFDLLLEGLGMQKNAGQKLNNLKAPMPGLIQSIAVAAGDEVNKGDTLLVLVAMKMENVIKSPGSGTIKTLKITAGEIVEKNQVLLEFQ